MAVNPLRTLLYLAAGSVAAATAYLSYAFVPFANEMPVRGAADCSVER
jgi:hypothetical protein